MTSGTVTGPVLIGALWWTSGFGSIQPLGVSFPIVSCYALFGFFFGGGEFFLVFFFKGGRGEG